MTISFADVREAAAVIAKDSEKRNPGGCYYTAQNGEHCVASEICVALGLRVPLWNEPGNFSTITEGVEDSFEDIRAYLDAPSLKYLRRMQQTADGGQTWGVAYKIAETCVPEIILSTEV